jgi:uncharacterized protein
VTARGRSRSGHHARHGIFVHDEPADRPAALFGGTTTLLSGADTPSYLLLPVIPA